MKVAFLIGSLNRGGAETLLLDIMNSKNQLPFDVILVHRMGGDYLTKFEETTYPVYKVMPRKFRYIHYLLELRALLKEQQIDIVHSHFGLNAIISRLAMIGTHIKIVTTYHGYMGYGPSVSMREKLHYIFSFICSNRLCFVSKYTREMYEKKYNLWTKSKSVVLYNGVNFSKIDIVRNSMQNNQPKEKCKVRFCMVGNFTSVRSQIVICKALAHIPNDVEFYFIGKQIETEEWRYNECVDYCKKHNLENVYFLGGRSDVPELLHQTDGFVYSTQNDTFGIAVVEAMAAGVPVVTNDHSIMKEITKNGQWATLFKTEDVEDCANKIEDLLNNLESRKEQAAEIAKQVREEYSIEKHIEQLANLYNEVINKQ